MSDDLRLWLELIELSPLKSWLVLSYVASTLIAVGFALVAGPRVRSGRDRALVLAPAVSLTLGSLATLIVLITLARERSLGMVLGTVERGWLSWVMALWEEHRWVALLAPVLVIAVPLTTIAVTRTLGSARALGRAVAFVSVAAGLGVSVMLGHLQSKLIFSSHTTSQTAFLQNAFVESSAVLDLMICFVVAAAVAALSAVLVVRMRSREPYHPRARISAGLVFVLGALAFAGTRGHAEDRRNRVVLVDEQLRPTNPVHVAPDWMDVTSCRELEIAPLVQISSGDHVFLDGRRLDADGMRQDLETMRRNWDVLHPGESFPGVLTITAPSTMSVVRLRDWLSVANEVGYAEVQIVFAVPELVTTSTLPPVNVTHHCAVRASLDPCATPSWSWPRTQTVEELTREIYEGRRDAIQVRLTRTHIYCSER